MPDVESLREQLRERGYLTHGIERWFALDPWSSRAFWVELVMVALKAGTLIGLFGALMPTAVMVMRNSPVGWVEPLWLFASYAVATIAGSFILIVLIALALKVRPALPIDTPRALLAISIVAAAALVTPAGFWWYSFDSPPEITEAIAGGALSVLFFIVAVVVVSAALLSFSIHELQRIPAVQRRSRGLPLAACAAVLLALMFVPAYARKEPVPARTMVVTAPSTRRVALIGVDGLTHDLFRSRAELASRLPHHYRAQPIQAESPAERWASLGTGVRTATHGVRAIEGIRFTGSSHVLQRISRADVILRKLAPESGIARREPLPPTVRRRDYVWEIVASRGSSAVAVNWWATAGFSGGGLEVVGPETIFAGAKDHPVRVDSLSIAALRDILQRTDPRFVTIYLPSLDVVLNRVESDLSVRVTRTVRVLEGLGDTVRFLRARGYDIILVSAPGEHQSGGGVIASSVSLSSGSQWDVAPTVLALLGFPASAEMPGRSLAREPQDERIASYGIRDSTAATAAVNQEYYRSLRSLGYIR